MQEKDREQRTLLLPRDRERAAVLEHLERSEDAELHVGSDANTAVTAALRQEPIFLAVGRDGAARRKERKMTISVHIGRKLAAAALASASVAIAVPVAHATDDAALMKAYLVSHPAMAAAIGSSVGQTRPTDAALMKAYLISHPAMAAAIGSSVGQTRPTDAALMKAYLVSHPAMAAAIGSSVGQTRPTDAALMKAYLVSHPAMATAIGSSLARTTGGGTTDAGPPLDVAGRGFDWGDALIGAAVTAGILLLGAAGGLRLRRRRELARP